MKKLFQLLIILAVSLLGELLAALLPLPIPGSIYGMVLMFVALLTGIIPLRSVQGVSRFLIEIMPVMFVPAAVGLMDSWDALMGMLVPCLIAVVPVTLIVMAASGHATQALLHGKKEDTHAADHR